jgi:hypothetical protein
VKRNKTREHRIEMEVIVDAYGSEEQAMGWYYYLEDRLGFPFKAKCFSERPISPLTTGETVEALSMAPEDDCLHEMFVLVRWSGRKLAVPLSQLKGVAVSDDAKEALSDWHYWVVMGCEF